MSPLRKDLSALADPFAASDVEWRMQSCGKSRDGKFWGKCLAYITNRAIMERLDDVCGPENWRNEYAAAPGATSGILCGIGIQIDAGQWVTKWDGAEETDIEHVKGGLSNAMKRAGVQWGIGRYLYNLDEGWATIVDDSDRSGFHGQTKDKEKFRWRPPVLPQWALPGGSGKPGVTVPAQPSAVRVAEAKAALANAEQRVGLRATPASGAPAIAAQAPGDDPCRRAAPRYEGAPPGPRGETHCRCCDARARSHHAGLEDARAITLRPHHRRDRRRARGSRDGGVQCGVISPRSSAARSRFCGARWRVRVIATAIRRSSCAAGSSIAAWTASGTSRRATCSCTGPIASAAMCRGAHHRRAHDPFVETARDRSVYAR
jgi:hypothetical protein